MARVANDSTESRKRMFKSCLAVAAPALIPLVILISSDALTTLRLTSLDRLGLLAAAVVFVTLAYFLWQRRWWAGLPALAIFLLAAVVFCWKIIRPLWAYYQVNPFNGPSGGFEPLLMVSPALVIIVLSVLLARLVFRGMKMAMGAPLPPLQTKVWALLLIWCALLVGDAAYQQYGWRYVKNPNNLVLRLCLGNDSERMEAARYLEDMGVKAIPALKQGVAAPGVNLECLREQSKMLLQKVEPLSTKSKTGITRAGG